MSIENKLIIEVINDYKFTEVCEIKVDNSGIPTFSYYGYEKHKNLCELNGGVYLWVIKLDNKPCEVIYVGKVDNSTLVGRNKMHERGFKDKGKGGSKSGGKLKDGIIERLVVNKEIKGQQIVIYTRHSEKRTVFGEKEISLCHAEEFALIQKFNNNDNFLLNEEGFRRRKKEENKKK
jgi:hypothetical protein